MCMGVLAAYKSVHHMKTLLTEARRGCVIRWLAMSSHVGVQAQAGSSEKAASGLNCEATILDLLCSLRQDLR